MTHDDPKSVGRFVRSEDANLLRGTARFVDDINLPGQLHVAFVRSQYAHAMINRIDTSEARKVSGVEAVFTHQDLRPLMIGDYISQRLPSAYARFHVDPFALVKDEATYVGEPIVMIVATSRRVAEDAAGLVDIDYDPLPAVVDVVAASEEGSPKTRLNCPDNIVGRTTLKYGDAEAAFVNAAHIVTEEFHIHKGGGHSIEGRALIAAFDPVAEVLTVWNSTQMPHRCKLLLVENLNLAEHQVRVITPDVGGGFGPKAVFHPEELAIAAAALVLKAPLKWIEDRFENFLSTVMERDQAWTVEMAVDENGRLLGVRGRVWHDHGSCTPYGLSLPYNSVNNMIGNYVLPSVDFDVLWCLTNKVATAATRGAGRPQGTFIMERMLDRVARKLGLDRTEVRRRNLIPADRMPYSIPVKMRDGSFMTYDSGDYPESQRRALEMAGWDGFAERREESASRGMLRGIGVSNYVELTGRGPFESVSIRIGPSGKVMVATGATTQGQSTKTTLGKLVADILHVDPDMVHVSCGDTAEAALGVGAFASRQTVTAGNSAVEAARLVAEKAMQIAAVLLDISIDNLELCDGAVHMKGSPERRKTLGELAKAVNGSIGFPMPGGLPPGLSATSNFQVQGTPYASGTHVAEVEVDRETAGVEILRYTVIHDCGTVLNPTVVDGQWLGGVVHGIGATLFEWMQYDEDGQPQTATYADYLLPSADVVPRIVVAHMESPSPLNPLGVKGAGEGGTIGAPAAIASAIEHALEPFDVTIRALPITPARLFAEMYKC